MILLRSAAIIGGTLAGLWYYMSAKRAQRKGFAPQLLSGPSYPYQPNLALPVKGAPNLAGSQTCAYHHWLPTVARTTCCNTAPSPVATHFPQRTARGRSLYLSTRKRKYARVQCHSRAKSLRSVSGHTIATMKSDFLPPQSQPCYLRGLSPP